MNQHDLSDKHLRRQRAAEIEEDRMEMEEEQSEEFIEEKKAALRHEAWQKHEEKPEPEKGQKQAPAAQTGERQK